MTDNKGEEEKKVQGYMVREEKKAEFEVFKVSKK